MSLLRTVVQWSEQAKPGEGKVFSKRLSAEGYNPALHVWDGSRCRYKKLHDKVIPLSAYNNFSWSIDNMVMADGLYRS
jgi:hypothetical protein